MRKEEEMSGVRMPLKFVEKQFRNIFVSECPYCHKPLGTLQKMELKTAGRCRCGECGRVIVAGKPIY